MASNPLRRTDAGECLHMISGQQTVLVAGRGNFIGGHLARALSERGFSVRAGDIKPFDQWWQIPDDVQPRRLDLSKLDDCREAVHGVETVYNLAANMGGIAFIHSHRAVGLNLDVRKIGKVKRISPCGACRSSTVRRVIACCAWLLWSASPVGAFVRAAPFVTNEMHPIGGVRR